MHRARKVVLREGDVLTGRSSAEHSFAQVVRRRGRGLGYPVSEIGQAHDAVGEALGLDAVVRDQYGAHPCAFEHSAQVIGESVVKFLVQTGQGFVEEHEFRSGG